MTKNPVKVILLVSVWLAYLVAPISAKEAPAPEPTLVPTPIPSPDHLYQCKIDLGSGSDCVYFVKVLEHNTATRQALLQLNMKYFNEAIIIVYYWGAQGWITNLGNSVTNNGAGGDGATNSFDSEIDLRGDSGQANLNAYTNDYYGPNSGSVYNLFEVQAETNILSYVFSDGNITVYRGHMPIDSSEAAQLDFIKKNRIATYRGEGFFQFDGWDKEAGAQNDRQFYLALNRVIDGTYRYGQGATSAKIILH